MWDLLCLLPRLLEKDIGYCNLYLYSFKSKQLKRWVNELTRFFSFTNSANTLAAIPTLAPRVKYSNLSSD
jgi:hypothetical protein